MKICFYLEYKELTGGYTNLILTLIKELYYSKIPVLLFNYKNGLIDRELKKQDININIIDLDEINWREIDEIIFPSDVLVITSFLEIFKNFFHVNPITVYYDINMLLPQISSYKYGFKFYFLGNKLIDKLLAQKSLVFMDYLGVEGLNRIFNKAVENPIYLPISVYVPTQNFFIKKENKTKDDVLNLTYVGRSEVWKMKPLKKIIEDCIEISNTVGIHISIVVDSIQEFTKFIDLDFYKAKSKLTFSLIENLLPGELDDFLKSKSDIHFAMGTAALDAAKYGIPTVLMDFSYKDFPSDYTYRWIYESTGFGIGKLLEDNIVEKGVLMNELIHTIKNNNERIIHSKNSYSHVKNQHSVKKIVPNLIKTCKNAKFRIKDAKSLVPYYFKLHQLIKKYL